MSVYVDNMAAKYRNMVMCHMIADTTEELLEMANKIGVNAKWIQYKGTYLEHFDICHTKRNKAVKLGAVDITMKQLGRITCSRIGSPLREHILNSAGIIISDPVNGELTDSQKTILEDYIIPPKPLFTKQEFDDLFNGSK